MKVWIALKLSGIGGKTLNVEVFSRILTPTRAGLLLRSLLIPLTCVLHPQPFGLNQRYSVTGSQTALGSADEWWIDSVAFT